MISHALLMDYLELRSNMVCHTDTATGHEKAQILLRFKPWWRRFIGIRVYMEFGVKIANIPDDVFNAEMQKALLLRKKTNCSLVFIKNELRIRTENLGYFRATFDGRVNTPTSCIGTWSFV